MIRKVVAAFLFLVVAATAGLVAGCGGALSSNAVAKVGQVVISQDQFDQRVADFEAQYASSIPNKETDPDGYNSFQLDVLDYMVTYELVSQKADSLNISVTEEQLQGQIDQILEQQFSGDQAAFDAELQKANITLDQLKQNYRESMLMQAAYDEITKSVTTAADADLAAYYEENKTQYHQDETRTVRHILISPEATDDTSTTTSGSSTTTTAAPTEDDWAAALAVAQTVREDLVGGADWIVEAAEYSDDPGSKDKGGDLGSVSKGEMVAEFDEAVFTLAKDEISQPVKTTYGYHVIQVTGITPAKQLTLEEVKDNVSDAVISKKKGELWIKWITDTKAEIPIIYKPGMEPTTTTTVAPTSTSSGGSTTTSQATGTTASGTSSTTATTAGSSITTAAPTTTTTAKP